MTDPYNYDAQAHIERLRKGTMVALEQVRLLHKWIGSRTQFSLVWSHHR